jgi:hypothetical protein
MHKLFAAIFRTKDEGDSEGGGFSKGRTYSKYGWFKTIKDVSEQLNENWDVTAKRGVIDFLSKLQYLLIEAEEKKEEMDIQRAMNGR